MFRKFGAFLKREPVYDNDPAHVLFLQRRVLLVLMSYFVFLALLMGLDGHSAVAALSVLYLAMTAGVFALTYRRRVRDTLVVSTALQVIWIIAFIYFCGWDCGVQHFMFELLVLVYFSVYDALLQKTLFAAALFLLRFSLFLYCRRYDPLLPLENSLIVILQIYNMTILFFLMSMICGSFSSNIESAEKQLVQYNKQLRQEADTDPLTGIWNRRRMLGYMQKQAQFCPEVPYVIAMGDIDHFKRINDTWGHSCGDEVLIWLTGLMHRMLSGKGQFCRWGGEEFLFYFPEMNGDEAVRLLNDMRMEMGREGFSHGCQTIPVTITFGVEEYDFRSEPDETIRKADAKLYRGKEQGRDRVVF